MKIIKKIEKGFILFITLMMLIIFAILGISLYQQTTMSTQNVQYVTFKQEAEDLAMLALNELEENVKGDTYTKRELCGETTAGPSGPVLVEKETRCDPITDAVINQALTDLRNGAGLIGGSNNIAGWDNLIAQGFKGSFSDDGDVYYVIQQLGQDSEGVGYLLYRITIIARVLDTYSVISAVTAVPEDDGT